jgi:hypothetical protein
MQFLPDFTQFACGAPTITLCQFAKRTQITFGSVAKGNWLPFLITLHAVTTNCMQRPSCFAIPLGELKLNGGQV